MCIIFWTILKESPVHHHAQEPYAGYFNMSLGYRRDSILASPYGYAIQLNKPLPDQEFQFTEQQLNDKNRTIAWFVSNCFTPSKRETYVQNLDQYIKVDK